MFYNLNFLLVVQNQNDNQIKTLQDFPDVTLDCNDSSDSRHTIMPCLDVAVKSFRQLAIHWKQGEKPSQSCHVKDDVLTCTSLLSSKPAALHPPSTSPYSFTSCKEEISLDPPQMCEFQMCELHPTIIILQHLKNKNIPPFLYLSRCKVNYI